MGKRVSPPDSGPIEPVNLKVALEERYLAYALSTIMHRALPDVRDGFKPSRTSGSARCMMVESA